MALPFYLNTYYNFVHFKSHFKWQNYKLKKAIKIIIKHRKSIVGNRHCVSKTT